jgi:glucosyl-dolichyl phosphate glucuronosyltransferase
LCSAPLRSGVLPTVSVVVPSKNRPREVARLLDSLRAQATLPLEVIVVDQSTPRYDLVPFAQLVHVHAPHLSGLTAARNAGIDCSRGEIVLFFDDDVFIKSDCVKEVARTFGAHPDVVGAQCTIHNPWDDAPASLYDISTRIFERGFFNSRPKRRRDQLVPRLIDGLASAYRRSLFANERFDEHLPGYGLAEDWDFTKRAARHGRLAVIPGARVDHEHSAANRHDPSSYMRLRRTNILYLYDKLHADSDIRNRFWKQWWLLGEELRRLRLEKRRACA